MKKIGLALLSLIIIIFLRFYQLGKLPQGLNIDGASYGYDAYSLIKTGKDQWGNKWPKIFRSYGDYKPSGLTYSIIPFITLFDLSTLSVRLPSALAGIGIVVFVFLTLKELTKNLTLSVLAALVFAFSPWAFNISRLFFEANVSLFWLSIQFYFYLKYFKNKKDKFLIYGTIFGAIGGYWQSAARYTSLFFLLIVIFLEFIKKPRMATLKKHLKYLLIFILILLPIFNQTFGQAGLIRIKQENQKRIIEAELAINDARRKCFITNNRSSNLAKLCYIFWNKPTYRLKELSSELVRAISPEYLFISNTEDYLIPKTYAPYLIYLFPAYFFGIYYLIKNWNSISTFLTLAFLGSTAIAISPGKPSIHRNVYALYLIFLIMSLGTEYFFRRLKNINQKLSKLLLSGFLFAAVFFHSGYMTFYFNVFPTLKNSEGNKDVKRIHKFVGSQSKQYQSIIDQAYFVGPILYAFNTKYSPSDYQKSTIWRKPNIHGNTIPIKVGKYQSNSNSLKELICNSDFPKSLLITDPQPELSNYAIYQTSDQTDKVLHEVYDLDKLKSVNDQEKIFPCNL